METEVEKGFSEIRTPRVAFAPVHIVCCCLAALVFWLLTTLVLYLTSDFEIQFIRRQVNAVRLCGVALLLSLLVLFVYPYQSQSLFWSIIRSFVTIFAAGWGMFVDDHALFRWLHVLCTVAAAGIDVFCATIHADLLDCQQSKRCPTKDPDWALEMAYVRQYVALSFEFLGLLYGAYVFQALGFFRSHILPSEYGIPRHLRELAKATITRKKLEAREPSLFDNRGVYSLFDPRDPLEIKWDTFMDTLLEGNRISWPISKNCRKVSTVSPEELQYRLNVLKKLGLPVEEYLKMREEREGS